MPVSSGQISLLLQQMATGNQDAMQKLVPLVYGELHRLAAHYMRDERKDHTLQPTALVHEAYLRLVNRQQANWQNKAHFFGVAAHVMRTILTDHARHHCRIKRGGVHQHKLSLDDVQLFSEERSDDLLALDESLRQLAQLDARQSRIVELRIFGGLTVDETAAVLGISSKTVKRDWTIARAWLYGDLNKGHALDS
jgi:RNA polymerase sigma-70 factor (ECF subfamily)